MYHKRLLLSDTVSLLAGRSARLRRIRTVRPRPTVVTEIAKAKTKPTRCEAPRTNWPYHERHAPTRQQDTVLISCCN